jgi:hypothetical protein
MPKDKAGVRRAWWVLDADDEPVESNLQEPLAQLIAARPFLLERYRNGLL